jgi:NSS family neurotransmitter:Na+ symporter
MLRSRAVWWVGSALFLLILFIVLCRTDMIENVVFGYTYPQILKDITLEKLTPIAAFFMSIFVGWVIDRRVSEQELQFKPRVYTVWRFLMRYLIPGLILLIFIQQFPVS